MALGIWTLQGRMISHSIISITRRGLRVNDAVSPRCTCGKKSPLALSLCYLTKYLELLTPGVKMTIAHDGKGVEFVGSTCGNPAGTRHF